MLIFRNGLRASAVILGLAMIMALNAPADAQEMRKVKFGTAVSLEALLPIFVAQQKGYLKEQGIDLEILRLGGARTRDALAAGEVTFGMLHVAPVWISAQRGLKIKFFSMYYTKEIFSILINAKMQDKIKSVKDLKGMTGMTWAPGSAAHAASVYLLNAGGGLDLGKDLKMSYVATGNPKVWLNAIETGKAQVLMATFEPLFTVGVSRGSVVPLLDPTDPKQHEKWYGGDANTLGIVTTEKTIQGDPKLVLGMVRAIDKGLAYIANASADELAGITIASKLISMDRKLLASTLKKIAPNYEPDGRPSVSKYDRAVEIYIKGGFLKAPIAFDKVANTSITGRAP